MERERTRDRVCEYACRRLVLALREEISFGLLPDSQLYRPFELQQCILNYKVSNIEIETASYRFKMSF